MEEGELLDGVPVDGVDREGRPRPPRESGRTEIHLFPLYVSLGGRSLRGIIDGGKGKG